MDLRISIEKKPNSTMNERLVTESYLENCHHELVKRQRDYKKIGLAPLKSRNETIVEASYMNQLDQLVKEKNNLRAQIWVAGGHTHQSQNERYLKNIELHVKCQESMARDIKYLKTCIANMEHNLHLTEKDIYKYNRCIVPESQHQAHVEKSRKKLVILNNALEVGLRRECGVSHANAMLREELVGVLQRRTTFNETYTKIVKTQNNNKKFMIELIEYALSTFDGCIDTYEKMNIVKRRDSKEHEQRKIELQSIMQREVSNEVNNKFLDIKSKKRELADVGKMEYKRRDEIRQKCNLKINLYTKIFNKLQNYLHARNLREVLASFHHQESKYYSYFKCANEISYHITLLNNKVERLYKEIIFQKNKNQKTFENELDKIKELEHILKQKRQVNKRLSEIDNKNTERLETLMQDFEWICNSCDTDISPLKHYLGDQKQINLVNYHRVLRILENRIQQATACVYIEERKEDTNEISAFAIREIEKYCEMPTNLNDIVLTQQCPECAEGDAFHRDIDCYTTITTIQEAKKKLYEKITQPEMQYRLHRISQCRLPRSRILAAAKQSN